MKHFRQITVARADAFTDFWNAIWRAWQAYRYDKASSISIL